jgi:ferrochelatase
MSEYLQHVTGGRPMPPQVIAELQHRYAEIGLKEEPLRDGPPLTRWTLRQAELLEDEVCTTVYVGMRNWHPFIADTLKQMTADGIEQAVAICLAPHNSQTSVGLYKQVLSGANAPFPIDFVEEWHDHPLLIEAFADRLRTGWKAACEQHGSALPVLFTAHSVPQRTIAEGDPYEKQTRETAALVVARVPEIGAWQFAFQSQGMSGGEWLGPTVEDTIVKLRESGQTGIFVQPIGFVCDHVEILFDIDILFREFAEARGMKLYRAESLNDSPLFVRAVADLAKARLTSMSPAASGSIQR